MADDFVAAADGTSDGPHLHFDKAWKHNSFAVRRDPRYDLPSALEKSMTDTIGREFDRVMAKAQVKWVDPTPLSSAAVEDCIKKLAAVTKMPPITIPSGGFIAPLDKPGVLGPEWEDVGYIDESYSFPQRWVLGIEGMELDPQTIKLATGTDTQQKETTMTDIDQTEFQPRTKAQKVKAERLAFVHLDNLVTITLPSGAEITDILTAVFVGVGNLTDRVHVRLANVWPHDNYGGQAQGFEIAPDSVVLVRKRRA